MLKYLSKAGLRPDYCYAAGFASIAASWVGHLTSRGNNDGKAQADRWGIYIGQWAPTWFALGVALKLEENDINPKTTDLKLGNN